MMTRCHPQHRDPGLTPAAGDDPGRQPLGPAPCGAPPQGAAGCRAQPGAAREGRGVLPGSQWTRVGRGGTAHWRAAGRGGAGAGSGEMAAAQSGPWRVGFVGAGRMAEAIAQGLIRAGGARGGFRHGSGVGGAGSPGRSSLACRDGIPQSPGEEPGQPGTCAQGTQSGARPRGRRPRRTLPRDSLYPERTAGRDVRGKASSRSPLQPAAASGRRVLEMWLA